MSKVTKFVYVSLNSNDDFQRAKRENSNIVPCSLYVDKEEQKIYFVEQQTGAIMDGNIYDVSLDNMININDKVLGL